MAFAAALIAALTVREGPYAAPQPAFDFRKIGDTFRNRKLRLANFGYLGHMWELYSMWGWIAVILAAASGWTKSQSEAATTLVIAIGAVNLDLERVLAGAFEPFRLGLVAVRLGDQAVQMRLQHTDILAHRLSDLNRTLGVPSG